MKKISKKLFGLSLGLLLTLGVSTAVEQHGTLGVKAAAPTIAELTFPDDNSSNNGLTKNQYTSKWIATSSTNKWSIANFNNNNWSNDWKYIRCGSKSAASVATISNTTRLTNIASIAITIGNYGEKSGQVNSFYVECGTDSSDVTKNKIEKTMSAGEIVFELGTTEYSYFKITVDCAKGTGNGFVQINKVTYLGESTTPEEEAEAWGKSFMETDTALTCEDENVDNSEDLELVWSLFEGEYNKISDDAKNVVKAAVGDNNGSTYLAKAVARYDHIIARYSSTHTEINDFIGRSSTASGLSKISKGIDNNNYLIVIFTISFISITAVGGYFFLRKRKVN